MSLLVKASYRVTSPKLPQSERGNPEDQPAGANEEEYEVPVPDHEEHLIVDHVEPQHTDGVHVGLAAARAPAVVVTRGCGHTG